MMVRQYMNLVVLGLMLSFFGWAWDARLIRSMILSLREREFTKTAILSGTGTVKLVLNEYMPFAMPLIFSTLINNMSWAIGLEITLAILGLVNLNIPTLGTMLNWAHLLPVYSIRTLVVDLDAGGLIALPVYRPLLALGQHQ